MDTMYAGWDVILQEMQALQEVDAEAAYGEPATQAKGPQRLIFDVDITSHPM